MLYFIRLDMSHVRERKYLHLNEYLPNSSQERFVEESLTSSLELYYVLCNYSSHHGGIIFSECIFLSTYSPYFSRCTIFLFLSSRRYLFIYLIINKT